MKTIIHNLNDGTGTSIICTIGHTVEYKACFGKKVEGRWGTLVNKEFAIKTLGYCRETLQSTVR